MAIHHIKHIPKPYPKMVTSPTGARHRVETATDHERLVAQWASTSARDELAREAAALGVKVDGRWSEARLREAIAEAK